MIHDVNEADFEAQVIERSLEVPVIVDFWAEWCGPCRQLTPALEAAVTARDGRVDLAKVDVDSNQSIAAAFMVQGIPAVKAFRNRQVVDQFTGAIPPRMIEEFLGRLVPSPIDELVAAGDEASLREALALDPRNGDTVVALARILIERGDEDSLAEGSRLLSGQRGDFVADGLLARIELTQDAPPELAGAFQAWDDGRPQEALAILQGAIAAEQTPSQRDALRRVMVAIFTELGPGDPLAREYRQQLASVLI